jgi:hypothetical protein
MGRGLPFHFEASGEWAHLKFSHLAEYSRYAVGDRDEQRLIRYRPTDARGFRAGISPHSGLEIGWTRLFATTYYEVDVDGVPVIDGDDSNGPPALLGRVYLRFDMISLRFRPARLAVGPVRPVFGVGFGWVLQSQQSTFRPPNSLPVDYSDSDKAIEATVGLRYEVSRLSAGAQLRTVHWNWDSGDPKIPAQTTHSWQLGFWLGFRL